MPHADLAVARDRIPVSGKKYVLIPGTIRAHGNGDFICNRFDSMFF
jgi:hypothetical protein